jgi:hypothetical protein
VQFEFHGARSRSPDRMFLVFALSRQDTASLGKPGQEKNSFRPRRGRKAPLPLAFSRQPFLLTALTPGLTAKLTAPTIQKPPSLLGPDGLTAKAPGGYPPVGHRKRRPVDAPPPPARPFFHPPRKPLAFSLQPFAFASVPAPTTPSADLSEDETGQETVNKR